MDLIERLKLGVAAFRGNGGTPLPLDGRSSEETLNGSMSMYLSGFSTVNPVIDFELLKTLKCLAIYNPDFSQFVANMVNLGNPGHSLSVDAGSDAAAEAAVTRLNEAATRLFTIGCGVDGLIGQYLTSVAWSGAISSEDVVNLTARRVEKVVLVPVEQIRFKYNKDTDQYDAYQRTHNIVNQARGVLGLIPLNTETYKYLALSTVENSPYAKPPATAAVQAILKGQEPIMDNIRWMAQKVGLMGLVAVGVAPLSKRGGETDAEYQARSQQHIKDFAAALDGNFNKGLVVVPKQNTLEHTPVTAGAAGVYDINRISEEQVASGLDIQPVFLGRTDSSTETFADVVYSQLIAKVAHMQRLVKRRQEMTYMLDLRLGGIDVDGVSLQFDKAHSRNALAEAQTDQTKFTDVLARVKNGMITPDEGAQALGRDVWADAELLFSQTGIAPKSSGQLSVVGGRQNGRSIRLKFDKFSQRYRHQPETIEIWSGEEGTADFRSEISNVVPLKKKANLA